MSDYDLTEMGRQLSNLVRIGTISELDVTNARVKVSVAGLTTEWLPWAASRAGTTRQWSPPKVGEQVIIASPYGDMAQAVVIGSVYQDDHPAPASSGDQERIVYPDGAFEDYNSASHEYMLNVPAGGKITLQVGASKIEISSSGVKITGPRIDLN